MWNLQHEAVVDWITQIDWQLAITLTLCLALLFKYSFLPGLVTLWICAFDDLSMMKTFCIK